MVLRQFVLRTMSPFLVAACMSSSGDRALASIDVGGRQVPADGVLTVGDALSRAHVVVPGGQVLSAVSHRPLGSDDRPGQVLVDGQLAVDETPVGPGAVVTVVPGVDVTEPLQVVTEPVPPDQRLSALYVGARPGSSRVVRGAVSGEEVARQVVRPPLDGHLVAPGAVALTFDDGPDPVWTPQVLAALKKAKAHATFCLIGRQAARYPDLVKAIRAAGNGLCNHTWDHDEHLATRPAPVIAEEMASTQAAIEAAVGVAPTLFRAPGGSWSPLVEAEARAHKMAPFRWTVDPRDWSRPGVDPIVGVVLAELQPGGVVLLHDGGGDRSETLAALSYLLPHLAALGYRFVVPHPAH